MTAVELKEQILRILLLKYGMTSVPKFEVLDENDEFKIKTAERILVVRKSEIESSESGINLNLIERLVGRLRQEWHLILLKYIGIMPAEEMLNILGKYE